MTKKIDYAKVLKNLVQKDERMVEVQGVQFPVKKPRELEMVQASKQLEAGEVDELQFTVLMVKACLPEGLTTDDVYELMKLDGLDNDETPLKQAVAEFVEQATHDMEDAFQAGLQGGELDADFTQPDHSVSQ